MNAIERSRGRGWLRAGLLPLTLALVGGSTDSPTTLAVHYKRLDGVTSGARPREPQAL